MDTSSDVSTGTSSTTGTGTGATETAETETAETEAAENETDGATRIGFTALPAKLTFRITPISLLAVMTVAICVTPVAWFVPWLFVIYLLPLGLLVWILRVRTDVTADSITATALGSTRMSWDDIRLVKLNERRWVRAVLNSGKEVLLPAVRVRDLPHLAAMSDGRLPDPGAPR